MIDKSKNHIYVIPVSYWRKNGEGKPKFETQMFTSNHQVTTPTFKKFLQDWIKKNVPTFIRFDEDWATQHTIPLDKFCK